MMDFFKRKTTVRTVAALDLVLTVFVLAVTTYKIIDGILDNLAPREGEDPIDAFTLTKHLILWCGLFTLHVIPLCAALALFRVTGMGREEVLDMISKSRTWLKSTLYLLITLCIMFVLFSLQSDVQSYVGAGICVTEGVIRLFFRCFVQPFYATLSNNN